GKPTQASASGKCLCQSRCTFNAAHARRLRSLLLLHFHLYRGSSRLARAAVKNRNGWINGTCAGDWLTRPSTKRCPPSPVSPQEEERHRILHLYSGLFASERRHVRHHPAQPHCLFCHLGPASILRPP